VQNVVTESGSKRGSASESNMKSNGILRRHNPQYPFAHAAPILDRFNSYHAYNRCNFQIYLKISIHSSNSLVSVANPVSYQMLERSTCKHMTRAGALLGRDGLIIDLISRLSNVL